MTTNTNNIDPPPSPAQPSDHDNATDALNEAFRLGLNAADLVVQRAVQECLERLARQGRLPANGAW